MSASTWTAEPAPVDYYNAVAPVYDSERFACRCGRILNEVELGIVSGMVEPQSRVLDVGTGTGRFSFAAATIPAVVVAIDAAKNMIAVAARKKTKDPSVEGIEFVVGDGHRLPFVASTFDVLISVKLLSHCQDIEPYIAEMSRVLKPGGRIIVDASHKLAGTYRHLLPDLAIQSHTDYFHAFPEIRDSLLRNAVDVSRRVSYSALPRGIVHRLFCPHESIVSTHGLTRLMSSRPGLLAFVEGRKRP